MMNKTLSKLFTTIFKSKIDTSVENESTNITESIDFLTFNESTLNYYRKSIRGNEDISEDQARRKMTRNMMLAYPYRQESRAKKHPRTFYTYGSLRFIVRDNIVISLINHQKVFKVWKKDWDKYNELNIRFEIDEKYIK